MTSEWKPTACILCECNCGLEVELGGEDGRHLVRLRGDKRHPSSRGYACEKAHRLDHYQHGRDRVHRRRCAGAPTAASRRSTGTPRSARSRRGSRRCATRHGGDVDLLLRRRRAGESPARRLRDGDAARARLALPLERARAGEDRRVLGQRPHDGRRSRAPTSSTATSRSSSARTPGTRTRSRARA